MTKLLETAIAKVKGPPIEAQDLAAKRLLECIEDYPFFDRLPIEDVLDAFEAGDFLTIATWREELGL
jgi:hypothetical protein